MTKAFDSALFIPASPNAGELVEVASPGPPLKTQWGNYISGPPGISVEASVPAATAEGQVLLSGPGPDFDWTPVVSSSSLPPPTGPGQTYVSGPSDPFGMQVAPAVPQPSAVMHVLYSGPMAGSAAFAWTSIGNIMSLGGALTIAGGTIVRGGAIVFTPVLSGTNVVLDGGDPTKSIADNFTIDAGTF